ncbi:anti-sigma factor antagonist [Planomonospora venezuelensis]|uniref:Anti-sigma factor antagonist n=1 Tax=Planomonospora venezuelensis TaxID=1999 RepID=A0A841CX58_PLAVE|nr:anti-sigma factor antagonist [Planomonospora venezuelensis]MBB5962501.1 anti-anti-sigma factor [Planomonospora venezuelensis]GIM99097.1 anti-sigma factor antagonist [Planomonospora venezuelensis]
MPTLPPAMSTPFSPGYDRRLSVSLVQHGAVMVAHVTGELDPSTVPVLREHLEPLWRRDDLTAVVLDAAGLTFCDSVGVSALIGALKQCQAAGKHLLLSAVHGTLARFLTITGLRRAFEIHDSAAEAVQAASRTAGEA